MGLESQLEYKKEGKFVGDLLNVGNKKRNLFFSFFGWEDYKLNLKVE